MWTNIIKEIESFGLTQRAIADACGVTQGFVSQLKNGRCKDIKSLTGQKLLALHKREMRKNKKAA